MKAAVGRWLGFIGRVSVLGVVGLSILGAFTAQAGEHHGEKLKLKGPACGEERGGRGDDRDRDDRDRDGQDRGGCRPPRPGDEDAVKLSATFVGSTDNDDGTVTLSFVVSNGCRNPLVYAAFSLPEGTAAVAPADKSVYTAAKRYHVKNTVEQPFHGLKFKSACDGIRRGETDVFQFTLAREVLAMLDGTQVALKAGDTEFQSESDIVVPATVGGFVWNDQVEDGRFVTGEPPMEGIHVVLWDFAGTPVVRGNTQTDADGFYVFESVPPGIYSVQVLAPSAFLFTAKDAPGVDEHEDSDARDYYRESDFGLTDSFVLDNGEEQMDVGAGLFQVLFPDVKANGSDDDIVLLATDPLQVTVALEAHDRVAGVEGEIWVIAQTPDRLYSYLHAERRWTAAGFFPALTIPLRDLGPVTVLDEVNAGRLLAEGITTFTVAVDPLPNGSLDDYIADSVNCTIVE